MYSQLFNSSLFLFFTSLAPLICIDSPSLMHLKSFSHIQINLNCSHFLKITPSYFLPMQSFLIFFLLNYRHQSFSMLSCIYSAIIVLKIVCLCMLMLRDRAFPTIFFSLMFGVLCERLVLLLKFCIARSTQLCHQHFF